MRKRQGLWGGAWVRLIKEWDAYIGPYLQHVLYAIHLLGSVVGVSFFCISILPSCLLPRYVLYIYIHLGIIFWRVCVVVLFYFQYKLQFKSHWL